MLICVGALLHCDGHILLGRRAATCVHYPGVWDLPGGHHEPGETCDETLTRELREEIGVTPLAWTLLAVLHGPGTAHDEALVLRVYVVTSWQGTPRNFLPEEHSEVAWVTVDDAYRLALAHPDYPAHFRQAAHLCAGVARHGHEALRSKSHCGDMDVWPRGKHASN
jgi:8-oxo-dGTP diphosphatase